MARPIRKQKTFADLSQPEQDLTLQVHMPHDRARIDRFLKDNLSWRSRTQIQDMIDRGEVLIEGVPATKPSQRVLHKQRVLIRIAGPDGPIDHSGIELRSLREDPYLLALDKPPGIICHPVGNTRFGTLINALHARYRRADNPALDIVPRLCHRLDRETSGLILVALAPGVRKRMQWIFETKRLVKEYYAVVEGLYPVDYEIIDLPIGAATESHVRIARGIDLEEGDVAQTVIIVEERFEPRPGDQGFTLLRASPITGRQHQIRVHVLSRGHPILGDTMYGSRKLEFRGFPEPPATPVLMRHALHAHRIQSPHPVTGEELDIRAPLPADMRLLLEYLRTR